MPEIRSSLRASLAALALGAIIVVLPTSVRGQETARSLASDVSASSPDQVRARILSKPAKLSVSDVSLETALDELESSSAVGIAYSPSLLPQDQRVTCLCEDLTIHEAIGQLLEHMPVELLVVGEQLVISQRNRLSAAAVTPAAGLIERARSALSLTVWQPTRRASSQHPVSGTVTSPDDGPLSNVSVTVKGTTIGILTGEDGYFALIAPTANDTLVFSSLGFQDQEVPIDGRSEIDVMLETRVLALEELVVVGYGTQDRASVTGSVSDIQSEDIQRTSATTTTDALIGKLAGINTRNTLNNTQFQVGGSAAFTGREAQDGRPGAQTAIQIRNMGDPLFVIDGVPQTQREFDHLNAADIETISVLKDAAASVYGFRASNGVILVTTKHGSPVQRSQLRVDGYYGWQSLRRSRSPWGWVDNAYQFRYSQLETEQNTGQARTITPEELELWRQGAPGYESYDAWNAIIDNQNAAQANFTASLSGGAGDASYYLSLGHVKQDYVMEDNTFNRTNFQANLRTQLFEGVSVGTELRGRLENHNNVAQTDADDPINMHFQSIQSTWPTENWYANGNPDYINGDVRYLVRSPAIYNRETSGTEDQVRRNFSGNLWVETSLPLDLTLRGTYNHTANWRDFDIHRYRYEAHCYDEATDSYEVCDAYDGGERQHAKELIRDHFGQLQLSYAPAQFGAHSVSAVAAFEATSREGDHTELRATTTNNINRLIDLENITYSRNEWFIERRASFVGRVNYDYQQKYLVEVLGRYDGSYLYASGQRWGLFPGVSVGWRLTEEPFLRDRFGFLDELKLRVSWGQTGLEQGVSPWGYLEGVNLENTSTVVGGALVRGLRPTGLPVTNLSWVTSTTRNVGVEIGLLDGKVAAEFDVFERRLTGLPAQRHDVLLPSEIGYGLPNENLETEANLGFEGIVRYTDQIGNLTFSIAPNFTIARRKILDRYKPRYGNSWDRYLNGTENRWAGIAGGGSFVLQAIGQFETMEEIANYPVDIDGQGNRTLLPGDVIYKDVNGDGMINDLDERPVGYATAIFGSNSPPILSFGVNGSFSYGSFTLTHDWAGGAAYTIWPYRLTQPYAADHVGHQSAWSRWRREDPFDDQSEWIPGRLPPLRKGQGDVHSSGRRSDFYQFNAKYLKLNRVELAYEIPTELTERVGVSPARVYVSAHNAWILDNARVWSIDPEQGQCCGQIYPPARNITVGFSATLGSRQ